MKPSGILNFENVPAGADDPDVKVYVNGELVETGGGGGSSDDALIIKDVSQTLNKTWQEIHDAFESLGIGNVLMSMMDIIFLYIIMV